ncbi:biotin transporter BioY [Paenibacillus gansuensis]|uniref:Biotin transporter n=1 Tax=Paenibacillus gansuensis TaxID=306542 RepID=A0ABW5PBN8_9BACL
MAQALSLRGVAFSALFAALVVVFGYVSIPLAFSPVPVTLQTLAVLLAGGLLGARYGFFSMMLIIVLTALGMPLLQGKGGLSTLLGPTGGYVIMWPFAAMLIGFVVSKLRSNNTAAFLTILLTMAFGSLLIFVTGVPWLAYAADLSFSKALAGGFYPFIIGDALKAIAATVITAAVRQVFPLERLTGHGHYAVRQQTVSK